jgi:hypothetical protein
VLRSGVIQLRGAARELNEEQLEQAYFGFDHRTGAAEAHF